MDNKNYATSLVVDQSPKEVFDAINNVRGWWSINIEGNTTTEGDEFVYFYKEVHISKMKIVALDPFKKVEWSILPKKKMNGKEIKLSFKFWSKPVTQNYSLHKKVLHHLTNVTSFATMPGRATFREV